MTNGYDEILYAFELQANYAVSIDEVESVNMITSTSIKRELKANLQLGLQKEQIEEIFGRMFPSPLKSKIQISSIFLSELYFDAYLKTHSFKEGKYFILPKGSLFHGTIQLEKELNKLLAGQIKESLSEINTIKIHSKSDTQILKCKTSILSLSPLFEAISQQQVVPEIINKKGEVQVGKIQLKECKSLAQEKLQIKEAIAKNDILNALNLMTNFVREEQKEYENDVILLKTCLNQIEMDVIRGLLSKEEEFANKNRLVYRVLKLTDIIFI